MRRGVVTADRLEAVTKNLEMSDRSKVVKESMLAAGNWRGREACVVNARDCSEKAPCRGCRQKGRQRQEEVASALCLLDEDMPDDPAWEEVVWVDAEAEARPKKSWWRQMLRDEGTKKR